MSRGVKKNEFAKPVPSSLSFNAVPWSPRKATREMQVQNVLVVYSKLSHVQSTSRRLYISIGTRVPFLTLFLVPFYGRGTLW
jgi:hypothetical protein